MFNYSMTKQAGTYNEIKKKTVYSINGFGKNGQIHANK